MRREREEGKNGKKLLLEVILLSSGFHEWEGKP
jgi:hypothetical protein